MASSLEGILGRLDDASDRLSPIVVKEVRQIVRQRGFLYSFALSLLAGLTIALLGGTSTARGSLSAGADIFTYLMYCLTIVGLVVAPIGTFMALRNERLERTFDLIMLTTLPPRRIVIGKILAQGVKLLTLFAGIAPFMAMSFLLGGVDLATILLSLTVLFLWSLWACAMCLFLSSAAKTRAVSGAMMAVMGIGYLILFGMGSGGAFIYMIRGLLYPGMYYGYYGGGSMWISMFAGGGSASQIWWTLAVMTTFCLVTMTNLILLAENCLALEDEDRTPALRVGLLAQFLMVIAWILISPLILPAGGGAFSASEGFYTMCGFCGFQLMVEAFFMSTGNLEMSRRTRLRDRPTRLFRGLTVIFRPGGGRAIGYVLAQMGILIAAGAALAPAGRDFRWLLAFCGYICFFSGVPTYLVRLLAPKRATPGWLRLAILVSLLIAMVTPELVQYFGSAAGRFEPYALRHILNPLAALGEWEILERTSHEWPVLAMGAAGLLAYVRLIVMARRKNVQPVSAPAAHAG
ncbi:MAG TPA: hypothetical protein VFY29_16940 [Terriglobia bacterium]|nr:hypothetical protein [Terriglobia bacterium]